MIWIILGLKVMLVVCWIQQGAQVLSSSGMMISMMPFSTMLIDLLLGSGVAAVDLKLNPTAH